MTISELINTQEELEPEAIRHFLLDLPEGDIQWIMAARTVKQTTHFVEDMYVFENIVRALNKLPVDFTQVQGVAPKHIWYAMDVIKRLWKDVKINYSWEVETYIKYIFNQDGVYGVYPFNRDEKDAVHEIAGALLNPNVQFNIDPANPKHISGQRLAEMLLYTQRIKQDERS